MATVFVQSFGCRASQSDGDTIETGLIHAGYESSRDAEAADFVILNTCAVTQQAENEVRRLVRVTHRRNPKARIVVTGCYAQRATHELRELPGVHLIVGNSHKSQLPALLGSAAEDYHGRILRRDFLREEPFDILPVADPAPGRTRPNLKLQDGCANRCSFCIIPSLRGPSRSAPIALAISQLQELTRRFAEVVLTGINLGRWGRDLPGRPSFDFLLEALLREAAPRRLRLSSVEPMDWTAHLIDLLASQPQFAQHVHMPLQSGSDVVLKNMRRRYRTRHYVQRLLAAWHRMPGAAFGADVMAGFPGETDAHFAETERFVEQLPLTYLHVFTYSERPGTEAVQLGGSVPMHIRRERTRVLRSISDRKNLEFRRSQVGKTLSVVTLQEPGMALTSNFLRVKLAHLREPNRIADVAIGGITEDGLYETNPLPVIS